MSMVEEVSWVVRSRPHRVDALMWVAEHAGVLGDGYAVTVTNGFDGDAQVGMVNVQGEPGSLQSLVERFGAEPAEARRPGWRRWVAHVGGVLVTFLEEAS